MLGQPPGMARVDPLAAQAAYYIVSGLWPVVHLRSFMALTGPKHDTWLVKTFGVAIASLGVSMVPRAGADRRTQRAFAVSSALALAAADAYYVARGRISPIYLADAAAELALAAALVVEAGEEAA
jgi:hypothetical protein